MTLFQNLREGLGGYFSQSASNPAKRTTRSSSLEEVKSRLDRDTVSPSKRTSEWLKAHSVEVRTPKALAVKGGKVTKPTPSKKQSAKAKGKFWARVLPKFLDKSTNEETQDLLEGTTVFGDDQIDTVYDDDNEATLLGPVASPNAQLAVPAPNAAEDEDTLYTPTAEDLEVMKKWSNDQVWLFHRLNRRGFEPLLPSTWDFEFVTLPPPVFSDDDSEVLIKARGGNEYNACRALQSLFMLGGRVRDRISCKLPPQEAIRREFLSYHKWSMMDAGLSNMDHIPVLAIGVAAPRESIASVVGRVTDSLHDLGRQYRAHFFDHIDPETKKAVYKKQLPTLYGIVIVKMIVEIVTYDSRIPGKSVQTMGVYNFAKLEQDVWHALSVAIVMCKARDYLVELREEEQYAEVIEEWEDTEIDA